MKNWCNKINKMYNLEFLRFSGEVGMEEFEAKWKKCVEYKYSLRFAELMGA